MAAARPRAVEDALRELAQPWRGTTSDLDPTLRLTAGTKATTFARTCRRSSTPSCISTERRPCRRWSGALRGARMSFRKRIQRRYDDAPRTTPA